MNDLIEEFVFENISPEDFEQILNAKFDFIETLEEYLKANKELERLMRLDLDPGSDEYDERCYLSDRVVVYEMQNFSILYPGSPYLKQFEGKEEKLEMLRSIIENR